MKGNLAKKLLTMGLAVVSSITLCASVSASTLDTESPTAPFGVSKVIQTGSNITINWVASSDNVGVDRYIVFADVTINENGAIRTFRTDTLATSTSNICTFPLFSGEQITRYHIVAVDAAGNISSPSEPLTIATDTEAPATPTNLRYIGSNDESISIAWDAAQDNLGIEQYYIYDNNAFVGSTVGTTFDVSRSVLLRDHINGPHNFRIQAVDFGGNTSPESQSLIVTIA
jgi:hypothetical protein